MSNEPARKLPLIKRVVVAMRGGGGPSGTTIVLVGSIAMFGSLAGFIVGVVAMQHHAMQLERHLVQEARAAHKQTTKALADKAAVVKQLADQTSALAVTRAEEQRLNTALAQAKAEHDAMQQLLDDKNGANKEGAKRAAPAKPAKAKPPQGASIKFGGRQCNLSNGLVNTKQDVQCQNLRQEIDIMNGGSSATRNHARTGSPPPKK